MSINVEVKFELLTQILAWIASGNLGMYFKLSDKILRRYIPSSIYTSATHGYVCRYLPTGSNTQVRTQEHPCACIFKDAQSMRHHTVTSVVAPTSYSQARRPVMHLLFFGPNQGAMLQTHACRMHCKSILGHNAESLASMVPTAGFKFIAPGRT